MKKRLCPYCKGKGYTRSVKQWVPAICSFGLTALIELSDEDKCHICSGTGVVDF